MIVNFVSVLLTNPCLILSYRFNRFLRTANFLVLSFIIVGFLGFVGNHRGRRSRFDLRGGLFLGLSLTITLAYQFIFIVLPLFFKSA